MTQKLLPLHGNNMSDKHVDRAAPTARATPHPPIVFRIFDSPFKLLVPSHSFSKEELAWFLSEEEVNFLWNEEQNLYSDKELCLNPSPNE